MNRTNEIETAIRYSLLPLRTGRNAYTIAREYLALRRLANRLSTIDVHRCNGTRYNDNDDGGYERACNRAYLQLDTICNPLALYYYHQSDPRGASLYIGTEPITQANYTNMLAIV